MTQPVDTETGEIIDDLNWTDERLLGTYAAAQQEAAEKAGYAGRLEMEIQRRITENGGTTLYGQGVNYVIETENKTDWTKMAPVLEFLTPEEKAEAFKPEHTITVPSVPEHDQLVPDKWAVKGTVMKLLRRHGDDAVAAADAATFPGQTSGKLVLMDNDKHTAETSN